MFLVTRSLSILSPTSKVPKPNFPSTQLTTALVLPASSCHPSSPSTYPLRHDAPLPPPTNTSPAPFPPPPLPHFAMRLYVYVLEARSLPPHPASASSHYYAKVKVGKHKSRTRLVCAAAAAVWNEEFVFRLGGGGGDGRVLVEIGVFRQYEAAGKELVGRVKLPVAAVAAVAVDEAAGRQSVKPTWFTLQPKHRRRAAAAAGKPSDCGKILITLSLYGENSDTAIIHAPSPYSSSRSDTDVEIEEPIRTEHSNSENGTVHLPRTQKSNHAVEQAVKDNSDRSTPTYSNSVSEDDDLRESSATTTTIDKDTEIKIRDAAFEDAMETMQSSSGSNMPEDLSGGVIFEHTWVIEPKDLNSFLFEPNSQFMKDLRELQGTLDYKEEPWTWKSREPPCLIRMCRYTKGATKLMKAVKATEEQTYLKADGKNFAVLTRVRTPEVPFGNCFEVVLLYKITPGPELSSGEESSHLAVSYHVEFLQSTLMKSMIEGSVREGLKENFESFGDTISQHVKPADSLELILDKEQLLAPLQMDHQSDMGLAVKYFCNFTVISTVIMGLYVLVHIILSGSGRTMGLEFNGLDLPDTFGELITSGILVLQIERLLSMISHFVEARLQRGGDHGVKAHGDGWLLTVALIEASNLPPVSSGSVDPYVVFSCNGVTRTSSVQLQTQEPQWNEIMEFDAMQEPPAVLDVEVFNFDGPFDLAISLGHAEVNFLKHTSAELADIWIPLEGKLAQTRQSQLHLRIFLDNTKGADTIREYLTKMEKEVGKKLNVQSPHKNSTFQKLFGLPPEEFLINDYACSLKRKLPLQGRLFLSARTVGFYANLFGHKTKFFFLWEDVEDIQVLPPSFTTVGSPSLLFILKSGRGLDAKNGAKSQDEEGRLKFQFHSFASFNKASRTIIGLWKTKSSAIDQRAKQEEDQQEDGKYIEIEDVESVLDIGDVTLSKEYTLEHPVNVNLLMETFDGGPLETRIMSRVGCLDYSVTRWEYIEPGVLERHVSYKFNRYMSIFGGEVVSTQLKSPHEEGDGWTIDDVMTLRNIPFSDYFRVHLRYNIQGVASDLPSCHCDIFVGIEWLKSTKFQKRITRNICEKLAHRAKEILELAEKEIVSARSC